MASELELTFDNRRVVRRLLCLCVSAQVLLVLLDCFVNYARWVDIGPIRRLFNITREDGIASWFAVTQTAFLALTLWGVWIVSRRTSASKWVTRAWLTLALWFSYMAMDDGAIIHERMGSALKQLASERERIDWFPSYAWQLIFVPPFAVLGLFMLGFLLKEFQRVWQRAAVVGALACMSFAVGLDFVEGLDEDHDWNVYAMIAESPALDDFTEQHFSQDAFTSLVHFSKSIEETLEMLAITLLWSATLYHLTELANGVWLTFGSASSSALTNPSRRAAH